MRERGGEPMLKSGFCAWPSLAGNSHEFCKVTTCDCVCHKKLGGQDAQ